MYTLHIHIFIYMFIYMFIYTCIIQIHTPPAVKKRNKTFPRSPILGYQSFPTSSKRCRWARSNFFRSLSFALQMMDVSNILKNIGMESTLVETTHMDVSQNRGTPKSSILIRFSNYKPSILGYPYFWKHPEMNVYLLWGRTLHVYLGIHSTKFM